MSSEGNDEKPIAITVDPTLPPNGMQLTYADGTVSRSIGFGSAPVASTRDWVEVTFTQAPRVTVTDEASEALFKVAQKIGRASGVGAEYVYGVLLRALANSEQAAFDEASDTDGGQLCANSDSVRESRKPSSQRPKRGTIG